MLTSVRVIGRIDLAEKVREALQGAGFHAELATAAPTAVFTGTPPADGVDVVVATSIFDPPLWRFAKRKQPSRPMVAVAERRRERALRGALSRRNGPDAYVTLPATPRELANAVQQAVGSASRRRSWGRADVAAALVWCGILVSNAGGVLGDLVRSTGALAAGVGLLIGVPFAWNWRWQTVGGVVLGVLGLAGVVSTAAQWFL